MLSRSGWREEKTPHDYTPAENFTSVTYTLLPVTTLELPTGLFVLVPLTDPGLAPVAWTAAAIHIEIWTGVGWSDMFLSAAALEFPVVLMVQAGFIRIANAHAANTYRIHGTRRNDN